ncbi:hypothetical protein CBR_g30080 [Chara braunii]|uniref:Integrase catalytic domain-containing protein n=1 Tax=Chara braunii TaxID=69332 RepID=A0A388LBZ9_CHABU|nr:hypothetical protein CBR_g30080 [Chara braunii]|eukprot:GBG79816.1 hypothetical protein CBR_g30080 [Chara braunii]
MPGYYRNFVENYSIVATPLTDLTRLDTPWEWTEKCEAAFRHLKHALTHYEVLKLPDPDKPFIVTTNASQYGIGAVLGQQEGKKLRLVKYMSKNMPSQKLAKSTYEKELYAVYEALTHWRQYLLGRFFILRTDHQTLRWMRTQPVLSDALKRWIEVIEQYDFEPQYIKGEYNKVVDALSRRPDFSAALITEFGLADNVTQSMVEAYREDQFMSEIIRRLEAKDKKTSAEFEWLTAFSRTDGDGTRYRGTATTQCQARSSCPFHRISATQVSATANQQADDSSSIEYGSDSTSLHRSSSRMSGPWTALMAESGTTMKPSSARHPQTDGQTERAHQTAQMMLRTLIRPDQKDWVDRLPDIEFAYNTSVHPAICVTPFELHHGGAKARIFTDILLPQAADIDVPCSPASVRKYRDLLIKARANMQKAQIRMQQQANQPRLPCPFREGDLVWVLSEEFALEQDVSRKLLPKWFGPWEVTSAVGDDPAGPSFVINIPPHLTMHSVFHASKLAIYTPPSDDEFPGRRSQDPPSMDGHQEVDRIITHRKHGNKPMQYKVTFKQCAPDDTRWISRTDLQTSAPLIFADCEKRRLAKEAARPARPAPVSDRQLHPRR